MGPILFIMVIIIMWSQSTSFNTAELLLSIPSLHFEKQVLSQMTGHRVYYFIHKDHSRIAWSGKDLFNSK